MTCAQPSATPNHVFVIDPARPMAGSAASGAGISDAAPPVDITDDARTAPYDLAAFNSVAPGYSPVWQAFATFR